jgi:hypothetical protein
MRRSLLLAFPLVAIVAASVAGTASAASAGSCRTNPPRVHDRAVFGHFSTLAAAKALASSAKKVDFSGIKIENEGCGDFEVEIDGADKPADRGSFAVEAARAGFEVTFQQTAPPLTKTPTSTYGVFATFGNITAANKLALRLAALSFRYIDIAYLNGKWLVVMPQVPVKAALSIAAEVHKAGFHIAFQS